MATNCQAWSAELSDDSLKSLFMAVERYRFHESRSTGHNAGLAASMLETQANVRIPLIERRAKESCKPSPPCFNAEPLRRDLLDIAKDMREGKPYGEVHDKAYKVDGKYALSAYDAFCSCNIK